MNRAPFLFVLSLLLLLSGAPQSSAETIEVSGYQKSLGGSAILYHAPLPRDTEALLVRAREDVPAIEWETAAVPAAAAGDRVRFTWVFGISVNSAGHGFRLFLNDRELLMFRRMSNYSPVLLQTQSRFTMPRPNRRAYDGFLARMDF